MLLHASIVNFYTKNEIFEAFFLSFQVTIKHGFLTHQHLQVTLGMLKPLSFMLRCQRHPIMDWCDDGKDPTLTTIVCHHSANPVMPNCDPQEEFFYPVSHSVVIGSCHLFLAPKLYNLSTVSNSKKVQ